MKISYRWLSEYMEGIPSPEVASELLTSTGLEVESVTAFESIRGGLRGVVLGEVLACTKHPNADKLTLCRVDIGGDSPLSIVCGAPNVAVGQKVPVATVGCTLYPFGKEEGFTIRRSKIRGEVSEGMICAEDELGIGPSHDGIMVLDTKAEPGTPAASYFNIFDDTVIEIGLTPNRTDAMSHLGVARDLAACISFREKRSSKVLWPPMDLPSSGNNSLPVEINIQNHEACKRYTGITLSDVKVGDSPDWLRNKLTAIGVKPHNNVVDVTNYVLHELGHPLHAFDYDQIADATIEVKNLAAGTPFTTLEGTERKLSADDLMICDTRKPLCIAGVYGGLGSGVTEKTTRVFLESAWFDPVSVRRSAKAHGLSTDASFRFERGADPHITVRALKRAAMILCDIAGARISSEIVDAGEYATTPPKTEVSLRLDRLQTLIGQEITKEEILSILELLDFSVTKDQHHTLLLEVPSYRCDVTREADVAEEVLRIYGMNHINIPPNIPVAFPVETTSGTRLLIKKFSAHLVHNGFFEAWNNSLTASGDTITPQEESLRVSVLNPLSQELNMLRDNMLMGLLENARHNINRKVTDLKLFEAGKTYHIIPGSSPEGVVTQRYDEQDKMGLLMTGYSTDESWRASRHEFTFWDIKEVVVQLLQLAGIKGEPVMEVFGGSNHLMPAAACLDHEQQPYVLIGKVADQMAMKAGIKQPVWYAEINLSRLLGVISDQPVLFAPLPRFPDVRRDLSLVVDQHITYHQVEQVVKKVAPKLIHHVTLFDVYESGNLPAGKKSYALAITLRDLEKTLSDREIDQVMDRIVAKLGKVHGAVLR